MRDDFVTAETPDSDHFPMLYECIISGQVPLEECARLLKHDAFFEYYCTRRGTRAAMQARRQAAAAMGLSNG
jgi:hypothetical protein